MLRSTFCKNIVTTTAFFGSTVGIKRGGGGGRGITTTTGVPAPIFIAVQRRWNTHPRTTEHSESNTNNNEGNDGDVTIKLVERMAATTGRDAANHIIAKLSGVERIQLLQTYGQQLPTANTTTTTTTLDKREEGDGTRIKDSDGVPYDPIPFPQLWRLAIRCAIPFFGFGVCDNLIMICVGDAIDSTFGVTLGFSTMVAAGLGQAVSDGSGITIQGFIENGADRIGLPRPNLSPSQESHWKTQWYMQFFRTLGIVVGCLVGLIPVIMFDTGNRPRLSDELLKSLPEHQRAELRAKQAQCTFAEGDYIMRFGEEAPAIFTVLSGELRVVGRNDFGEPTEIASIYPGDSTGVIEIVLGHMCVADVIVVTPSARCMVLSREDIEEVEGGMSSMRKNVQDYVSHDDNFLPYRMRFMHSSREEEDDDGDEPSNSVVLSADEKIVEAARQSSATTTSFNNDKPADQLPSSALSDTAAARAQKKKDKKASWTLPAAEDRGCIDLYYNNQALEINKWVRSKRQDEEEEEDGGEGNALPSPPSKL